MEMIPTISGAVIVVLLGYYFWVMIRAGFK